MAVSYLCADVCVLTCVHSHVFALRCVPLHVCSLLHGSRMRGAFVVLNTIWGISSGHFFFYIIYCHVFKVLDLEGDASHQARFC